MVFFVLFLLAILPIILSCFIDKNRSKNRAPGPRGLPVIGNLHQFDSFHSLSELSRKHGPLMSLRLASIPTVVVSSARVAREVFKTHDLAFSSRPSLVSLSKLSYRGLDLGFCPYNDYWKEMRKVCHLHLFNSRRIHSFRPVREDEVSRLIDRISKDVASSKVIDLSELAIALTSNIICRVAFGKRYDEETKRFKRLLNESQAVLGGFFVQDYFPYMGWVDILTRLRSRLQSIFMELDAFYQEIIDEHLDSNRPASDVEDFVDVLIGIKRDCSFSTELTWDHIKGVLMNLFLAGTDTGATTLVWAMTMMMKHPSVLKKVQEEIRSNIVTGNRGIIPEDDIEKHPYLKAVVKESMRMHPASPLLLPRETIQHCNIDGYHIAPKTRVYINAWAIGRDSEAWARPDEFYPERFLGSSVDFRGQHHEFIPFGAGRRMCPGIHLGTATVDLALLNLLRAFDWELPSGMNSQHVDTSALPGITVHKKVPLCLVAKQAAS